MDLPTVSFATSSISVTEGSNASLRMTRSGGATTVTIPVTVTLDSAEESDLDTAQLTSVKNGFSFLNTSASSTKTLGAEQDTDTDDETFTVAIDTANLPTGYVVGSVTSVTVTITDDEPSDLTVTPADGTLNLSWTAPSGTLTGYDVHYTSAASSGSDLVADDATASGNDASAAWVAVTRSGATASQTISSLTNNIAYRVRVRAKTSSANSAWVFETGTPRSLSTDATLSDLTASSSTSASGTFTALTLDQSFAAGTTAYTATVASNVTHVKLTPTVNDSNATVKVGKETSLTAMTSGSASGAIALNEGANVITVEVTAEDRSATKTYTVTVTRGVRTVSLSVSPNPVEEGASVTVTATLSAPAASALTIPVTVSTASPNTAESGDVGTLTSITVNAGAATGTATITTNHDTGDNHETFTVSLGTLPTGYEAGSASSVQVTINDDEGVVLSVVGDPACGSTITDLSAKPLVRLRVTPVTGTETEVRLVDAQGNAISTSSNRPERWQRTLSVRGDGLIVYTPLQTTFARLQLWPGFAGFQFRLRDNTSVTAECTWQFDHSGRGTPTDTTTTTPPITGDGGTTGGGGGSTPRDRRPSFGSTRVPDQSYTEGTEIPPLELPEARGGDGRLFYALSPVLPEGLTLNRRVRRLSGTPTSSHAARQYTWTATDADGDAARITFTVTVVPDKPSFDNVSVPDQSYTEGTAITPLVLPEATGGNNPLTYALSPSLPNGLTLNDVTRRLSGNPISPQDTTLYTWTATDADGDEATLTFTIAIAVDPHRQRVREAARRILVEMARRAMSGALDTIGARFGAVGGSGLSLAGQPVSLESVASVADGVGMAVWNNQSLALGELLGERAFSLRLAASGEAGDGDVNLEEEGPLWSVWGRGDLASFAGGREEETHYDGWLRSGWLGIDARSGRWVAGLALSHEQGQADYGATMAAVGDRPLQGRLETSLTALYPYGRWRLNDGMELQGVVGVGWGEAHHTPADEQRETGTLSMRMASLGVRQALPDVAGLDLALRADAAVTRIETGDGPEVIHNLSADSWRLRTGLEASRRFSLEGEAFLEPFLEAAARQDGGDGLEGSGVELAGGLRYSAPNVAVELRGRWLAAHSEEGAEEQGVSLTARYGPGTDGQGLFFALSPRWGAATGGAQALWGEDLPVLSTADAGNSGAMDAQVGYGFALPQGGVLTPFAEVGLAGSDSRRLRLGTRYAATVTGLDMAVELAGERRESGDAAAEHALQLDVDLRF